MCARLVGVYMRRSAASFTLILLTAVSGCGSSAGDDHCTSAQASKTDSKKFAKDLAKQDASFNEADMLKHAAAGDTTEVERGVLYATALTMQVVSDNPRCFAVTEVAEARRALKLFDSLEPLLPPTSGTP